MPWKLKKMLRFPLDGLWTVKHVMANIVYNFGGQDQRQEEGELIGE